MDEPSQVKPRARPSQLNPDVFATLLEYMLHTKSGHNLATLIIVIHIDNTKIDTSLLMLCLAVEALVALAAWVADGDHVTQVRQHA